MKVHRLMFDIGGQEAPAGYRVRLPDDTFSFPDAAIDGLAIRVASPLALCQIRTGIARQGTFGELSERQREAGRALRAKYFPDLSDAEVEPEIRPLS